MGEERNITPEERIWLINEVMNANGFHGLLERIENKLNENNSRDTSQVINHSNIPQKTKNDENKFVSEETPVITPDDKMYNYVEESGMYEKDTLHLVAAEFGNNINGKPLNGDAQIEAPSNQAALAEIYEPVQTSKHEIDENNISVNQELTGDKPLVKTREPEKNNPWSSARTVLPGEIKLS